jgi:hypothetical protein
MKMPKGSRLPCQTHTVGDLTFGIFICYECNNYSPCFPAGFQLKRRDA